MGNFLLGIQLKTDRSTNVNGEFARSFANFAKRDYQFTVHLLKTKQAFFAVSIASFAVSVSRARESSAQNAR